MIKKEKLIFIGLLLLSAGLLSACTGGATVANSWPGFTVDTALESVFVANNTQVYAVNLLNGSERWRFPAEPDNKVTFFAPPVLSDSDQLIVGGYDGVLYSLNPQSGAELWRFEGAEQRYVASPWVGEDIVLAPSADGNLYALDLEGNLLWTFSDSSHGLWGTPVAAEGVVYQPALDHHVYALTQESGNVLWVSEDLGGLILTRPLLTSNGTLIVGTSGTHNPELVALDTQNNGAVLWRFKTDGWIWSPPALVEGVLYFGDLSGTLFALGVEDGQEVWHVQPEDGDKRGIAGTPLVTDDTVYFASESGKIFAIDRLNGNPKWNKPFEAKLYQGPLAGDDAILLAPMGSDALLMALDMNGNQKWSFVPEK